MLTIPKSQRHIVERLVAMPSEQLTKLAEVLSTIPSTDSLRKLAKQADEHLKVGQSTLFEILQVLYGVGSVPDDEGLQPKDIAQQLVSAAQTDGNMQPADGNWERLTRDLSSLFEASGSTVLTGKTIELVSDNQHSYCATNSRIITDIRAVFPPGDIQNPAAAAIVHMLKLAYHESGDTKAFFLALDPDDVRHLRSMLERAIAKEAMLGKMISASGTPIVGLTEDRHGA